MWEKEKLLFSKDLYSRQVKTRACLGKGYNRIRTADQFHLSPYLFLNRQITRSHRNLVKGISEVAKHEKIYIINSTQRYTLTSMECLALKGTNNSFGIKFLAFVSCFFFQDISTL